MWDSHWNFQFPMQNVTDHHDSCAFLWCVAKLSWFPFISNVLMDSERLRDFHVAIDQVRKVWEGDTGISLAFFPFVSKISFRGLRE
jgi:hypothetical protein